MKYILLFLSLFLFSSSCFAYEKIQLKSNTDYLYFTDGIIKNIKSSNPKAVEGKLIASYLGNSSQIMFSAINEGYTNIEITTDKTTIIYNVEVTENTNKRNDNFMEIDVPSVKTEN